ncbi:MAG: phosphodiesterase [Acutalibacteraceae bacterium]|nr:phosphodiesterase [Acutalibacteraceae bacterium]
MKFLIASDIHGSAIYCEKLINALNKENADKILLLGDLLYHGPRNDLPDGYAPKTVISMLNGIKEKIIAVRGNCDTEVDQMVLDFPILADYAILLCKNRLIYATHGHIFNPDNLPNFNKGDILLNGHTHITAYEEREGYYYFNPGSVSIPKNNTERGYIIFEDTTFTWKTLDGKTIHSISL